jgi:hypothetical protein
MCARSCLLPPVPLVPDSQFAAEALGESTDGYDAMGGAPAGEGAGAAGVSSDGYDAMGMGGRGGRRGRCPIHITALVARVRALHSLLASSPQPAMCSRRYQWRFGSIR